MFCFEYNRNYRMLIAFQSEKKIESFDVLRTAKNVDDSYCIASNEIG
jgi:hypothetical protein